MPARTTQTEDNTAPIRTVLDSLCMRRKEYSEFLSSIPMALRFQMMRGLLRSVALLIWLVLSGVAMLFATTPDRRTPALLQSIESAIQAAGFSEAPTQVVVRGIVTSSPHRIVIEDRTGAIEVKPGEGEPISLGDEGEVRGLMTF